MIYDSFLFEGHGHSDVTGGFDPGAVNGNVTENQLVDKINKSAKNYLDKTGLSIHYDENNYNDNDIAGNSYKFNCGLSVHINSAPGASGVEIFVPNKEGYLVNDTKLVEEISKLLDIPNRGVKSRNYATGSTYLRKHGEKIQATDYYKEIRDAWGQGVSLSLLEVGFIQNDLKKMQDRIDEIGYLIAKYIAANCNKTLQDKPATDDKPKEILYKGFVNNKQIFDKTLSKWVPQLISTHINAGVYEVKIIRCDDNF
ncbi:MAG: N-acetylmuramoyl-L-alanine amidase [Cetobacterium sp.]